MAQRTRPPVTWAEANTPMPGSPLTMLEFFEASIAAGGDFGCWHWTGLVSVSGYGLMPTFDGGLLGAHRLSYTVHFAPIPDGLVLDHRCRVRTCVNPWHLDPVTYKVNWWRSFGYCSDVQAQRKWRRAQAARGKVPKRKRVPKAA